MKSCTNIEQSKRLSEILPIESADHHYVRKVTDFKANTHLELCSIIDEKFRENHFVGEIKKNDGRLNIEINRCIITDS